MNRRLPAVVLGLAIAAGPKLVHAEDRVAGQGDSIDEGNASPVMLRQDQRTSLRIFEPFDPTVSYAVNSPIIYLHRCVGTSCTVNKNTTDSRQNRSSIIFPNGGGTQGTLSAFSQGNAVWNATLACVRSTFAPFAGITVTDQDPGNVPHYEIMVGGTPGQLGFDNNTAGVSPGTCPGAGISNSLVFVFDVFGGNPNELCATAAQEVAHSWGLDHSTDASDPMSYFQFSGQRAFKNANVSCGSDCVGGQGPNGGTCTNQVRQCHIPFCPASPTQNTFAMIDDLFGDGTPTPPTVTIAQPTLGAHVDPGFDVVSMIDDHNEVIKAELYLNNELVQTVTSRPFRFKAPDDLAEGTYTVKVTGYDIFNTPGSNQVQVIIGKPCDKPGDCPLNTDTCIGGRCVPGPGVQGGLGSPCTAPTECASGICASSEDGAFCVEQCMLGGEQCPDGFGCLDTMSGDGNGVCYPGYDDGGGCLSAGGSSGPITVGLAFAMLLLVRRRGRS